MAMIIDPIEALKEILDLTDYGISLTSYEENYNFELSDEDFIENAKHVFEQIDTLCDNVIFSHELHD